MYTVFKIPGGKEIKYEAGQYEAFENLVQAAKKALLDPGDDIIITDGKSWDTVIEKLNQTKGFHTYGVVVTFFPDGMEMDPKSDFVRDNLKELDLTWIDLITKTYTIQILRLGTFVAGESSNSHKYNSEGNLKEGYKD